MPEFILERQITLPAPLDRVFPFFARAANLERLTPPFLRFEIRTPEVEMGEGALLDYRIRLHGFPMRWRSRITVWEPPHRFVDEQTQGPYRTWIHEHRFREQDGQTEVHDRVRYAVPGGTLVHRLFVEPDLRKIFDYRHQVLREVFPGEATPSPGR